MLLDYLKKLRFYSVQECPAVTRLQCWNVYFLTVRSFLIWPRHYLSTGCTGHTTLRPSARLIQTTLLQGKEQSGMEISPNRVQRQSPPHAVRSQRTCSGWPNVKTRVEEPHRTVSIQTVRMEENQFLCPTALQPSMPLTWCLEGEGNSQDTESSVGCQDNCSCWFAMTLKQSFCVSNILKAMEEADCMRMSGAET